MSQHLAVSIMLLALAACGGAKKAAEQAIAAADSAVSAVAPEAQAVAPELLQPLTTAVNEAKDALAAKDYEKAAGLSTDIPARAAEVSVKVEQAKKDLAADFATLSGTMPTNLVAVKAKLDRPPRSLSRERLSELRATIDSAVVAWPAIIGEYQSGAIASAMSKAFALKARVSEVMVALGMAADEKAWGNLVSQPK